MEEEASRKTCDASEELTDRERRRDREALLEERLDLFLDFFLLSQESDAFCFSSVISPALVHGSVDPGPSLNCP